MIGIYTGLKVENKATRFFERPQLFSLVIFLPLFPVWELESKKFEKEHKMNMKMHTYWMFIK